MPDQDVQYFVSPPFSNDALNNLFAAAWPNHTPTDFGPILGQSLAYVCAYLDMDLVGFVNLAWDGGIHAFLLDTTVHPDVQRQGIGKRLVYEAATVAQAKGIVWLH